MCVIVAIKESGVVYMGADTQTTTGRRKRNGLNETSFMITRLENGMLVGFCGKVAAKQAIGIIYTDSNEDNKTELYFQLYKDRSILNPSLWLAQ